MVINENVKRKIIPIAGGKGGVGKTVLSANLALSLADNGKNTIVIDLDLGGSNLHTCLGLKNNKPGIGNFISSRELLFENLVQKTPYKNLRFIAGDVLVPGLANINFSQKKRLLNNILKLDADYVILDLGSGSNFNVIDFFLISNSGFTVTTGQTTSVLNLYGFLKSLVFRFLMRAFNQNEEVSLYLKNIAKEKDPKSFVNIAQIIKNINKIDPESGRKAKNYITVLKPQIVINMADSPDVLLIVEKLRDLIKKSLILDVDCMGLIYSDDTVNRALSENLPVYVKNRHSIVSKDIERIAQKIIQSHRFPDMPLDFTYYRDTFELTQIEAQNDYQEVAGLTKLEEEVKISKLLTVIDKQKQHIKDLEGTVRMLTQNKSLYG